jgi:hypothetical protein
LGSKAASNYAVFDLRGHRLGSVEIRESTEAESLKRAGYGKGIYLLRDLSGKNAHLVPISQ